MSVNRWPLFWVAWLFMGGLAAAPPRQDATPTAPEATAPAVTAEATTPFAPPVWVSPTPDETGAIIVIVQPGESLWVIAARAGLTLPDLLTLNSLTESSIINPGDNLIIGYATPEASGPEGGAPEESTPTATPPPPTPRPTETRPEAAVCLTAFDDLDQDGIHDPDEALRAGVAFTVYNTEAVVANYVTDGRSEPKCMGGLVPGEYRVTRSIRPGEVLTTEGDWSLNLTAGSELYQSFGSFMAAAQSSVPVTAGGQPTTAVAVPTSPPAGAPSPASSDGGSMAPRVAGVIALFLGGLLLLGAVLILLLRQLRSRPGEIHSPDPPEGERRFRNIDDLE